MLYELVELARRFQKERRMPPISYKLESINWIIDLNGDKPHLKGPFKRGEFREVFAPSQTRTSNILPLLLLDDARYALGIPENENSVDEIEKMHTSFIDLLKKAYQETNIDELKKIIDFISKPIPDEFLKKIKPRDKVTFQIDEDLLFERQEIQQFWAEHLAENLLSKEEAECAICCQNKRFIRRTTRWISLFRERPMLASFNKDAFTSFGKEQTKNVPICFSCTTLIVDTINFLLNEPQYHSVVIYKDKDPLRSQMAVYWLNQQVEIEMKETKIELENILAAPIQYIFDEETKRRLPPPELEQLQELVELPKTGRVQALRLDEAAFYMGILSANKGRLVVREWIHSSVLNLLEHFRKYLDAIRIVHPTGETGNIQPLPVFLQAIESTDVHLVRQLFRTIYHGYSPPNQLLVATLQRFRLPRVLTEKKETWRYAALASLLKLVLTYGKEEAITMESLNPGYLKPAYLCGRLLAILEEIQQRASGFKVGSTIVQRFYGAASTAPASTFGPLLRLATTAHLPKVSAEMARLLEEVIQQLDKAGGFPSTLSMKQQAEFGLGFYHQRAEFSSRRKK